MFFAGEATNATYIGTVHGAYFTGVNAANLMIKSLNQGNSAFKIEQTNYLILAAMIFYIFKIIV